MGDGLVRCELGRHVVSFQCDERALVAHTVAVVGGGEDRDALGVVIDLVTLILDLVTPDDVVELVQCEELVRHVRTELAADAALRR